VQQQHIFVVAFMPFAMQGDDEWPVSSGLVGQEEQMIHVIDQRMLRFDPVATAIPLRLQAGGTEGDEGQQYTHPLEDRKAPIDRVSRPDG
tara:strand:+ start:636 stop:905 length:270 start_codon:yes stop_codon:yes gene_type:complete